MKKSAGISRPKNKIVKITLVDGMTSFKTNKISEDILEIIVDGVHTYYVKSFQYTFETLERAMLAANSLEKKADEINIVEIK